jgi:hypothetical protein
LYENTFNGNSILINGDTDINQKEIQLHRRPTTTNIESIKNTIGTFKMVAIGGGLTAGARDGGLYRNGQLTSFPNLIAIQMKADFKQPLFAQNESNGYGYKVVSNVSNGIPKYKSVSNNIALLKSSPVVELNPYNGEIDNWGIPFSADYDLRWDRELAPYNSWSNPYKSRILLNVNQQGKNNAEYNILSRKFDFILIESGLDTYIKAVIAGTSFSSGSPALSPLPSTTIVGYANSIKAKIVIGNIPSITDLPYFNIVNFDEIRKVNKSELDIAIRELNGMDYPILGVPNGSIMIPNSLADSLLNPNIPANKKRGLSYKTPLNPNEVYLYDKVKSLLSNLENQNKFIESGTKSYAVVDLYTLYKKVAKSDFISNDGIKVTQQNFFSTDGIFPSAFGQAIIANEFIKTMNSFY